MDTALALSEQFAVLSNLLVFGIPVCGMVRLQMSSWNCLFCLSLLISLLTSHFFMVQFCANNRLTIRGSFSSFTAATEPMHLVKVAS